MMTYNQMEEKRCFSKLLDHKTYTAILFMKIRFSVIQNWIYLSGVACPSVFYLLTIALLKSVLVCTFLDLRASHFPFFSDILQIKMKINSLKF